MRSVISTGLLVCALAMASPWASAHAFPDNSSPHVGATVAEAPNEVKVWFDGEIEPVFSTLIVTNGAGQQVSTGKGGVNAKDHTLLETALPPGTPAGVYTVTWSVIAHDGHHTEGHFTYTVK